MRVLFVTAHKHLPELHGGMEINTHELAKGFLERGVQVGVLCGLAGVGFTGFQARLKIRALNQNCPFDTVMGYPTWRAWNSAEYVKSVVEKFKPDVLVLQGGADFPVLLDACLKTELPVFCYLHTADRLPINSEVLSNPRLFFIANSEFTYKLHPEKRFIGIVRPIIKADRYKTATDRSSAIFVNPKPHKGVEIALELVAARPDVPFLFTVVSKQHKAELSGQKYIKSLPNLRLVGPFNDMRKVYSKGRIVLAPSQCLETWGRIATEAHAVGLPVLGSTQGGLPEAIGPGGIALPYDAPISRWVDAFNSLWDDQTYYKNVCDSVQHYSSRPEIDCDKTINHLLKILKCDDVATYQVA